VERETAPSPTPTTKCVQAHCREWVQMLMVLRSLRYDSLQPHLWLWLGGTHGYSRSCAQMRQRYKKIYEDYTAATMYWKEVLLGR
jgi:hypothetical protein